MKRTRLWVIASIFGLSVAIIAALAALAGYRYPSADEIILAAIIPTALWFFIGEDPADDEHDIIDHLIEK